jgi:trehalose 6-phosphate phosphatase
VTLPRAATSQGQAGLDALLADPRHALIAADFDGTLSPIVDRPADARAHPGAVPALAALAQVVGTVAVITGRPAQEAVTLGGLAAVPGLVVLGHYGWQRWQDGQLADAPSPPAVQAAREALPGVLREAGAPDGTWVEDKAHAVAVHTRGTADPEGALSRLRGPLGELAGRLGLAAEPGRLVIELRPPGVDKGSALTGLAGERAARSVLFCGDDLGDLPAFAAVRALRADGIPGCAVASASAESPQVADAADLVVDGPGGVVELLTELAGQIKDLAAERGGVSRPGHSLSEVSWSPSHRAGGSAAAVAASAALRRWRSASGMTSAWCRASAVSEMSYGLTSRASAASVAAAPASRESTSAQPRSESTGPSWATRFMPSLIGLTSSTSASAQAASDRG